MEYLRSAGSYSGLDGGQMTMGVGIVTSVAREMIGFNLISIPQLPCYEPPLYKEKQLLHVATLQHELLLQLLLVELFLCLVIVLPA